MTLDRQKLPLWTRGPVAILVIFLAYCVTGSLGLFLALPPGYATAVWPPSGIALAAVLLCGRRALPAVVLGSFVLNVGTQLDPSVPASAVKVFGIAATIALAAAAQAALGAFLIGRVVDEPGSFVREEQIIQFLIIGGPLACLVCASVAVPLLVVAGSLPPGGAIYTWCTWWVGDTIGAILFAPLVLVWTVRSEAMTRRRRLSISAPILVVFSIAVIAFGYASSWEQYKLEHDFARRADGVVQTLRKAIDGYLDLLYATRGLFSSQPDLDREAFRRFAEAYVEHHPGIRALQWHTWVDGDERAVFEQAQRRAGDPGFEIRERDERGELRRAASRAAYVVATWAEPIQSNREPIGYDMLSDEATRDVLGQAQRSGRPIATAAGPLSHDARPRAGMSIFLKVPGAAADGDAPRGFVAAVMQIQQVMNAALGGVSLDGLDLALYEQSGPRAGLIYQHTGGSILSEALSRPVAAVRVPILVAGRQWVLALSVSRGWALANRSLQAWTVLASGVLFTALLGAFLLVLTGRTALVEGVVRERTAELERLAVERERATDALRRSEERHRMLAEQSSDFISRHRLSGLVTYASPASNTLFGFEPSEIVGRSGYDFFHPADIEAARREMRAAIVGGGIAMLNYRTRCKDGGHVWVETSLRVLRDPITERPTEMLAVTRDVSERKRAERMRQDLVAMLSHDLKNPLSAVLGFAEILREMPHDDERRDEFLARIEANAHAALTLAINFVDASQIESGKIEPRLEPVFLNEIVEHVLRHQESRAKLKQIRVETRLDRSAPMALLDRRLVDRVIANLVNNAIKFTPAKTVVMVETAIRDGRVAVRVQDQGPGIAAAERTKLFQRFSEMAGKRPDSTGLGLFIVKTLVDAQGGIVGADFPPEGGTVFEVSFPAGDRL